MAGPILAERQTRLYQRSRFQPLSREPRGTNTTTTARPGSQGPINENPSMGSLYRRPNTLGELTVQEKKLDDFVTARPHDTEKFARGSTLVQQALARTQRRGSTFAEEINASPKSDPVVAATETLIAEITAQLATTPSPDQAPVTEAPSSTLQQPEVAGHRRRETLREKIGNLVDKVMLSHVGTRRRINRGK